MKKVMLSITAMLMIILCGCDGLRFPVKESQKQNAWLHNRTAQLTADKVKDEGASEQLQQLSSLSEVQSRAFVYDYGLPEMFPPAGTADQILSQANRDITFGAISDSQLRPDVWDIADGAIELGIGLAGLFGGVFGVRIAAFLRQARTKSDALREIIYGNEAFKKLNKDSVAAFKSAHRDQSTQTKQIVTEVKNL